jgi:2'-5' RNA ligase
MAERWFFGLWPDPATGETLAAQARPLIPRGARATHPLDIHLTLRFLSELSPEAFRAAARIGDAVQAGGFRLRVDRAGWFPRARVLWCAPNQAPEALFDLVARLERALAAHGFPPETRPYRPHLTLARKFRMEGPLVWDKPVIWTASEFVLARGLEGQVPRYAAAQRWSLVMGN